jgi:hypothetical protein
MLLSSTFGASTPGDILIVVLARGNGAKLKTLADRQHKSRQKPAAEWIDQKMKTAK